MFNPQWLEKPDVEGGFPTNGARFAALELKKRMDNEGFTRKGFMLQAIAAGWHHKSAQQLNEIANNVGRNRIQVLHGTLDAMITVPHGEVLVRELGGEEKGITRVVFEDGSHGLPMEKRADLKSILADFIEQTRVLP